MTRTPWIPLFCVLSVLATAGAAYAAAPTRTSAAPVPAGPPALDARSVILVEALTGAVLFESRADERIPPASLTKLMTLHLALQEIE
ncbi:MAG: serine-type D-Ala-D-Ala carboxypeptidase, partial [Spirochaetia bacterium]